MNFKTSISTETFKIKIIYNSCPSESEHLSKNMSKLRKNGGILEELHIQLPDKKSLHQNRWFQHALRVPLNRILKMLLHHRPQG